MVGVLVYNIWTTKEIEMHTLNAKNARKITNNTNTRFVETARRKKRNPEKRNQDVRDGIKRANKMFKGLVAKILREARNGCSLASLSIECSGSTGSNDSNNACMNKLQRRFERLGFRVSISGGYIAGEEVLLVEW